jgi:DASS family divalent anion:Na+ symporter
VKTLIARAAVLSLLVILWVCPAPEGLKPEAWRLFAIFASTIAAVVVNALPILTASVLAVAIAVLTGTLTGPRRTPASPTGRSSSS